MANKPIVKIDHVEFSSASAFLLNKAWPDAVAKALGDTARQAKYKVQSRMRRTYALHTQFIPNAVQSYPHFKGNYSRVARSIRKSGRGEAYVRLRPASAPKYSLDHMKDHEYGTYKTPHGVNSNIAVPTKDFKETGIYTPSGKVKKRKKPSGLNGAGGGKLPEVSLDVSSSWKNIKGLPKGGAFVVKDRDTRYITRKGVEKGRFFEVLYSLTDKTKQATLLQMEHTVKTEARNRLQKNMAKNMAMMKIKFKKS